MSTRSLADLTSEMSSRVIGTNGLPIVAGQAGGELAIARCADTACNSSTVETLTPIGGDTSGTDVAMAVLPDGRPVISYTTSFNGGTVELRICTDPTCTASTLALPSAVATVGRGTSVAVGRDGLPIFSYRSNSGFLQVVHCGNAACSAATDTIADPDPVAFIGSDSSITIGADGLPVVSYRNEKNTPVTGSDDTLRVVHCGDMACATANRTITDVDTDAGSGFSTAIAIGSDGLPVIAHRSSVSGAVRVVHCTNVFCTPNVVRG